MRQLPYDVQLRLIKDYMFSQFLKELREIFKIPKLKKEHSAPKKRWMRLLDINYTWTDEAYQNYMLEFLLLLEPFYIEGHNVFVKENDEWLEIMYFQKGSY
jgi:hypothetical protein